MVTFGALKKTNGKKLHRSQQDYVLARRQNDFLEDFENIDIE